MYRKFTKQYSHKPKLPRKTKKAAINEQGRKWYYDTIKLWKLCQEDELLIEPVCKFWVNSSVVCTPTVLSDGQVVASMIPLKYW